MEAKVTWKGGLAFSGAAGSELEIPLNIDSKAGERSGFQPMELVAIGLAGCTGMDVISILQKKKQEVTGFKVQVRAEQATEYPHVFTNILIEYFVEGKDIDPAAVERSIELSATKYCPVQAMLAKSVNIQSFYQITQPT